ncbi:isopenicillin N synthase family oxygenase [Parahaliea maris]|uniref:2-oxoglutarate-dependent ethylene/succinate-forming enzyme n=1 Tax=Parahaliea maris TaxID=2716870 RepID=A0A5C9A5G9_9GAMM|nr:2OG-Fe(II) oxygenase family protein [Parahaliea maris]TXS95329.1 isopenicillin N synthase family oxygenase [Parahaliea maris]
MTTETGSNAVSLSELELERSIGGMGEELGDAVIPLIDMSDFDQRKLEIADQLWEAATGVGFFQLENHGLPQSEIDAAFDASADFFGQAESFKARYPLKEGQNAGWEYQAQVRPSVGVADRKESYQLTLPRMDGLWPDEEILPRFRPDVLNLEYKAWELGMRVLSCFALKLGFEEDFFTRAHDREQADYQSTLRLLHYLPVPEGASLPANAWRAGAHTDFDCLTMVFQKTGQGGLQVCAGKDAARSQSWAPVEPRDGILTCNIGDMLMRWSDDRLKSTLHRVRMPRPGEYAGSRYSIAFFCQANSGAVIQGPQKVYEPITAADYLRLRLQANFG